MLKLILKHNYFVIHVNLLCNSFLFGKLIKRRVQRAPHAQPLSPLRPGRGTGLAAAACGQGHGAARGFP